jgi:hypothetical protein
MVPISEQGKQLTLQRAKGTRIRFEDNNDKIIIAKHLPPTVNVSSTFSCSAPTVKSDDSNKATPRELVESVPDQTYRDFTPALEIAKTTIRQKYSYLEQEGLGSIP